MKNFLSSWLEQGTEPLTAQGVPSLHNTCLSLIFKWYRHLVIKSFFFVRKQLWTPLVQPYNVGGEACFNFTLTTCQNAKNAERVSNSAADDPVNKQIEYGVLLPLSIHYKQVNLHYHLTLVIFRDDEHVSNANPETTIKSFRDSFQPRSLLQLVEHMPRDGSECLHFSVWLAPVG